MSSQSPEQIEYHGEIWNLTHTSTGRYPFVPNDYGIHAVGASTADARGFRSSFSIRDKRLFLDTIHIYPDPTVHGESLGNLSLSLFGHEPTKEQYFNRRLLLGFIPFGKVSFASGYVIYENMDMPISFSGGILICKDARGRWPLSVWAFWFYRMVELVFDDGMLVYEEDCSHVLADYWQESTEGGKMFGQGSIIQRCQIPTIHENLIQDGTTPCICHPSLECVYPVFTWK